MKIAINALASSSGGGYAYLLQLVTQLSALAAGHQYLVLTQREWEPGVARGDKIEFRHLPALSLPRRTAYEQFILPAVLRQARADFLYSPTEVACLRSGCAQVLGIQNPNPHLNPGVRWGLRDSLRLPLLRAASFVSARAVKHIVFVSETSRRQILRSLGNPRTPSSVVYHGVDRTRFAERESLGLSERKGVLCVAAVERHKNLETLLRAYARLPQSRRAEHPLEIVGALNDKAYAGWLKRLANALDIAGSIRFSGEVDFSQMMGAYQHARVFVLPSLLETFGMPVLEAMAAGVPVLASAASCLPEICGDGAIYFQPRDDADLARELERLLTDDELAGRLRACGLERSRLYTWQGAAEKMLAIFERVSRES